METRLDRFEVLAELGRGGGGVVYRCRDPRDGGERAVKVMPRTGGSVGEPPPEVQALARLEHPGIVRLLETVVEPDRVLLVTELVEGRDLRHSLKLPLMDQRLWSILPELMNALEYLHSRGVVHGDLKPANVLIDGAGRIRLTDFGLSRLHGEERSATGLFRGTPAYAAPEVCRGMPPDRRSDLYSLGIMLYEWTTGGRPLDGPSTMDTLRRHLRERPRSPGLLREDLPPALERAVLKLLEKEPAQRFHSLDVLWEALQPVIPPSHREQFAPVLSGGTMLQRPVLCGRSTELDRLLEAVDRGSGEAAEIRFLIGEPGIGRTRLLEEVRFLRSWEGPTFLAPEPYEALESFLERLDRISREAPTVVIWDDLQDARPEVLPGLVELLRTEPPTGTWLLGIRTGELLADPLADWLEEVRSARSELLISLPPLEEGEIRDLIGSALGTGELPAPWLRRVSQASEGNPLLAWEIVRDDLDAGTLTHGGRGWLVRRQPRRSISIPARRSPERAVMELLAVAGCPLPEGALAGAEDFPAEVLGPAAHQLVHRGTLRRGPGGLAFRLPGIREAVETAVPGTRRRALHSLLAEFLSRHLQVGDDLETPTRLVLHRLGAGEESTVLPALLELAEGSAARGGHRESLDWFLRALDLAQGRSGQEQRMEILGRIGLQARLVGEIGEARRAYHELEKLAERLEEPESGGRAALGLGGLDHLTGDLTGAEEHFQRAAELLHRAGDPELEGRARLGAGVIRFSRGDLTGSRTEGSAALELFRGAGATRGEIRALRLLGDAAYSAGLYGEAAERQTAACGLAESMDAELDVAACQGSLGLALHATGRLGPALERYDRARELFQRLGHPGGLGVALVNIGQARLDRGEPRVALERLDQAVQVLKQAGQSLGLASALSARASAQEALGEAELAAADRESALKAAREGDDPLVEARILIHGARAAREQGYLEQAGRLVGRALEITGRLNDRAATGEATLLAGRLAGEQGRFDLARRQFRAALSLQQAIGARSGEAETAVELALLALDTGADPEAARTGLCGATSLARACQARPIAIRALVGQMEAAFRLGRSDQVAEAGAELVDLLQEVDDRAALRHLFFRAVPVGMKLPEEVLELARIAVRSRRAAGPLVRLFARGVLGALSGKGAAAHRRKAQEEAEALGLTQARDALELSDTHPRGIPPEEPGETPKEGRAMSNPIRSLLSGAQALFGTLDADALLLAVMDQVVEVTGAERGFLMLRDPEGPLTFRVSRNVRREEVSRPEFATSRSIIDHVVGSGQPFLSADILADERFGSHESIQALGLRSVLCVPIPRAGGEDMAQEPAAAQGVIYVDNPFEKGLFSQAERMLLEALAALTSLALANLRTAQDLRAAKESADAENLRLRRELAGRYRLGNLIGRSPVMQTLYDLIERIQSSSAPVLITGETGTGKELVARTLHSGGPRREAPFVAINCAALPESLLEAELFGIEKGVATGVTARPGVIERAHRGTLFLDEVGDMSPATQARLLRALQERVVQRVGGRKDIAVDIRVISATNRDLAEEIREGRFREDLLYRLNVISLDLPALRRRVEDIPLLARHFLDQFAREEGKELSGFAPEVLSCMAAYPWPGNVRELENVIHRAVVLEGGAQISRESLPDQLATRPDAATPLALEGGGLREVILRVERRLLLSALERADGVKKDAAEILELTPRMLSHYLKKHDLL